MEPITNSDELKNAIKILEFDQQITEQHLKEQVYLAIETFKPGSLIKCTLQEVASSPFLIDNIFGATVGLASGYLTRMLVVSRSAKIFRNLLGSVIQFGVTKLVAKHSIAIKSVGQFIHRHLLFKNEVNSEKL